MAWRAITKLLTRSDGAYEGHLDGMNGDAIYGWALKIAEPARELTVRIYHEGVGIGEAVAREFREDLRLAKIGLGHGSYGFHFDVPPKIRALRNYTLRAYVGNKKELTGSWRYARLPSCRSANAAIMYGISWRCSIFLEVESRSERSICPRKLPRERSCGMSTRRRPKN